MKEKTYEILITAAYYVSHAFIGMIPILFATTTLFLICWDAGSMMDSTYNTESGFKGSVWMGLDKIKPKLSFSKSIKVYRVTYLMWESVMQFGWILYPTLILAAYLVNVVTTFAVLRLYNELPLTMTAMFAFIDVAMLVNTITFHAYALGITVDYRDFMQFWKSRLMSSETRRILRSCIPIRVKIGSFFYLNEGTVLSTGAQIVDMTVTLLLA